MLLQVFVNASMEQYMLTAGLLVAFLGLITAAIVSRRRIAEALRESGLDRGAVVMLAVAIAVFLSMESALVQPTQQLYFDDVIYQAMAQQFIHSGQAWFCDYGTPSACFQGYGELFHEPIGESFNLALGFLTLGVSRDSAFDVQILLGACGVLLLFMSSLLLFRDRIAAFFSSLIMAMEPVLLLWARPTNSDLATLTYSLVALFSVLVFSRKRSVWTLAMAGMSTALSTYMKVDAIAYVVLLPLVYLLVDGRGIADSVRSNLRLAYANVMNTDVLIVLLVFVIAIAPELIYAQQQLGGGFGYQGTYMQNTCATAAGAAPVQATSAIDLQNLMLNICGNAAFWFDNYAGQPGYPMPQPIPITMMAILGAAAMLIWERSRRILLALGIWFLFFFLLYSAFYAGSVTYGVDWRFQLSMIAQTSMFGGFFAASVVDAAARRSGAGVSGRIGWDRVTTGGSPAARLARRHVHDERDMLKRQRLDEALLSKASAAERNRIIVKNRIAYEGIVSAHETAEQVMSRPHGRTAGRAAGPGVSQLIIAAVVIAVLAYSAYAEAPGVSIPASQISQAQPARFYEGFVYNESSAINNTCMVFSYDPTIFNLVGKTAAQMFELSNPQQYLQFKQQYPCLVLDWGYWCTTPGNICASMKSSYVLEPEALGTDDFQGQSYTFGFYLINGTRQSTTVIPVSSPAPK